MSTSDYIKTFLEKKLKEEDLRIVDLARSVDIAYSTLYSIVKGKRGNQEIFTLIKIADFFHMTIDEIIGRKQVSNKKCKIRRVAYEEIQINIKQFLNEKMQENNIDAYTLAKKLKIGETVLFDFIKEDSRKKLLSSNTLIKLADFFHVSIDKIIGRIIESPPQVTL